MRYLITGLPITLKNKMDLIISELELEVKKIYDEMDQFNLNEIEERKLNKSITKFQPESMKEPLERIRKNIFLSRLSFNEDDKDFEKKYEIWWGAKMRYIRSRRLIDYGAPSLIILNELNWLYIMVDHMCKLYQGIEPQFTEDQREDLEALYAMERELDEIEE